MPESTELITTPTEKASEQGWGRTLEGMLRACLNRAQPVEAQVKAYLQALQTEGENPQAVYGELLAQRNPEFPPAPPYEQVAPPSSDVTSLNSEPSAQPELEQPEQQPVPRRQVRRVPLNPSP